MTSVLVLTGSLGGGHDALAAGCRAALDGAGVDSEILDVVGCLGYGRGPARAADRVFRSVLGVPALYDAFHFDQLRTGGWLARGAERLAVQRAAPVVAARLDGGYVDTVLSVFATGAGVAARLKAERRCRRSVVFIPDACAHRMWVHDATDAFLVTSPAGAASVRRYRPHAPVSVVAPLLRPEFSRPPSRDSARRRLGLPATGSCVLVMGGAWGLGPMVATSAALAVAGHEVIAVAGRNPSLLTGLRAAAERDPRVHPVGFSDQMASLMAASDLVVTTAGMSCAEARAVGRRLVLLDVVPGHGRENLAHELERGAAAVSQPDPPSVVATVEASLASLAAPAPAPAPADAATNRRAFLEALAGAGVPGLAVGEAPVAAG